MKRAFTLIELLVVITIIVVLLALLAPALDKAIYQAELAVCGANLRGMGSSVTLYAMDHKRSYPHRNLEATDWQQPVMLADPNKGYDLRPAIEGYTQWDAFLDPLSAEVDVSPEGTEPDSIIMLPYALRFGTGFSSEGTAMMRIGRGFTWTEDGVRHRFSVLAADPDLINRGGWVGGAHPDADGIMRNQVHQDEVGGEYIGGVGTWGSGRFVISRWEGPGATTHGLIDRNFVFEDHSVLRLSDFHWDDWDHSGRTVRIPPIVATQSGQSTLDAHDSLPPQ